MEASIITSNTPTTIGECEPGTIASKPGSGMKFVVLLFNQVMYDDYSTIVMSSTTKVAVHGKLNLKLDKD